MPPQSKQPPPQFALVIKEMSSGLLTNGIAYILPDKLGKAEAKFLELAKLALKPLDAPTVGGDWTPRFLLVTTDVATEMRLLTAAQATIEKEESK